jgi:hypothetical protein
VQRDQATIDRSLSRGAVFGNAATSVQVFPIVRANVDPARVIGFKSVGNLKQFLTAASRLAKGRSAANFIGLMGFRNVRNVDHRMLQPVTIKSFTARTSHNRARLLCRHPFTAFPHRIFPFGPVPLISPGLEIGLSPLRQERCPRLLEIGAGLVEGRSGAVRAFAGFAAGIKAAGPFPWLSVVGCQSGSRSCRPAYHRSRGASIRRGLQDSGGGRG